MKKIQNVVIINDFDYIQGGASKVAIETANILSQDENLNVYFFSGDTKNSNDLNNNVISVCIKTGECLKDKNKIRGILNGIYNLKAKKDLKKILNTLDTENTIIHIHGWTKCLSSSVFDIAFKMNFKVVLTLHDYFSACPNGGFFNYKKNEICHLRGGNYKCLCTNCDSRNYFFKLYRNLRFFIQNRVIKLNKRINNIIFISDFSWNILKSNFRNDINAKLIYNPIVFESDDDEIDINKNEYFLYVGRISKEKGVDIFCEAITKTNKKGIVVGDGDEKQKLEEMYPNIIFTGWKDSRDIKEYMKAAKALIMPSRWYEGAPLTNLEALSVGIPSIVTNNCAASDVSNEKNETGYVFNIEDNSLEIILNNDELKNVRNKKILYKYLPENYKEEIIIYFENINK